MVLSRSRSRSRTPIDKKQPIDPKGFTQEQLSAYIQSHPEVFEGMTQDELYSWVNEQWGQYQQGNQGGGAPMFGVFGESPQYQIPQEIFDQLNIATQTAQAGIRGAENIRKSSMDTLKEGVEGTLGTMRGARDEALGIARQDIDRIRDIQERSRGAALDQAYASRKETLAELQGGGDRALDIMRLQAFGGLPGERATREQMNANFAATQQAVKERAGGGSGALGALAQGYGQSMAGERQLAVDRAQYQAEGMSRLAEGEFAQSGRMADAMRQSRLDIADTEMATAQNMSDAYLATSEYLTGQVGGYARDIANAQFRGGEAMSSMDYTTGQNVIDRGYQGAAFVNQALQGVADQRQRQFAVNQYEPYVAQRDFMLNELQRLDPFGVEVQMYGDVMGQGYSQYMQGVSGQAQGYTNTGNAFANTMAQGSQVDWSQYANKNDDDGGGNKVTYGSPVYDDPWEGGASAYYNDETGEITYR